MSKIYDLEERTFQFAKDFTLFVRTLSKTVTNVEYGKQGVRSTGSVAANYIEANESLSKKDFIMRAKICRKEAKESALWIRLLIELNDSKLSQEGTRLLQEANELKKIFSAMIEKSS